MHPDIYQALGRLAAALRQCEPPWLTSEYPHALAELRRLRGCVVAELAAIGDPATYDAGDEQRPNLDGVEPLLIRIADLLARPAVFEQSALACGVMMTELFPKSAP